MSLRRVLPRRIPGGAGHLAAPLVLLALLVAGIPARGDDGSGLAPVPAYHGYVNDEAGVIGETRAAQLESFLDQLHQKTAVQFAVLTVASSEPEDPMQFKVRVFNAWGIGDKERKDGLLLLVSMKEHALHFETGYGLEGTLPDGWEARMLRDLAVPEFRNGDPAAGITAAVLAASSRYRRRGWYSGWGGGFGGFGGGFGGGSFSSGGGGFGGFGGGSSGGGGGGAHW